MKISDRLLRLWAIARTIQFYGWLAIALAFGMAIGRLVDSPAYQSIRSVVTDHPRLAKLLDVEGMLIDALVSAFASLFLVWSLVLYVYGARREVDAASINRWAPISGYLSGAPGSLIAIWGATLTGFGLYGLQHYGRESVGPALIVHGLLLLAIGMWLRAVTRPLIVGRDRLHRHARKFAVIPGAIGIAACLFVIISDPIRLLLIAREIYENLA